MDGREDLGLARTIVSASVAPFLGGGLKAKFPHSLASAFIQGQNLPIRLLVGANLTHLI